MSSLAATMYSLVTLRLKNKWYLSLCFTCLFKARETHIFLMSFQICLKWKTCSVTALVTAVNHFDSIDVAFALSPDCAPLSYSSWWPSDKVSAKHLDLQIHCSALHDYPPFGGWVIENAFGWYVLFRHDTNSQQHKQDPKKKSARRTDCKGPFD